MNFFQAISFAKSCVILLIQVFLLKIILVWWKNTYCHQYFFLSLWELFWKRPLWTSSEAALPPGEHDSFNSIFHQPVYRPYCQGLCVPTSRNVLVLTEKGLCYIHGRVYSTNNRGSLKLSKIRGKCFSAFSSCTVREPSKGSFFRENRLCGFEV